MRGIEGANDISEGSVTSLQATLCEGRGRNTFSSCPHYHKDDTPLTNAPTVLLFCLTSLGVICEHKNRPGKWFDDWFVTVIEPTT